MALFDDVLRELQSRAPVRGPDMNGDYLTLCLFHSDKQHPNLHVHPQKGFHCFACGAGGSITKLATELGVSPTTEREHREIEIIYHYCDAKGKPFEVVRFRPKGFAQRRPDGNGGYLWNLKGIVPTLYKHDEVKSAIAKGEAIYVVEGEKDAETLRRSGFVATTNPGGAGKWHERYSGFLSGAQVIIIADKDASGRTHARQVAKALGGKANSIKLLELPDRARPIKDCSDWLDAGGTANELRSLVAGTPEHRVAQDKEYVQVGLTDTANAEYLVALHGHKIRYDHLAGRWLLWDGHRWHQDIGDSIYRLAISAVRKRYTEASDIADLEKREKVARWCIQSEHRSRLDASIYLARMLEPVSEDGQNWDANSWLLGVLNGAVNLRTGEFSTGRPEDRLTMSCRVPCDEQARCPRWLQFLDEIFQGDDELIDWLQRALGYSITGDTSEQAIFLLTGRGANGKSVLLSILRYILGDYAYDAPFSTFDLHRRASIPNDLAALRKTRLVTSSETSETARLNEARVKALTGGDTITARFLHREFFSFEPVLKLWLATNHLPRIADLSSGFWRRVRVIPFNRQFVIDADKGLGEKLRQEAEGILTWLVAGCLKWQTSGLEPTPGIVANAIAEYYYDSDPLGDFLSGCCIAHAEASARAADLYRAYVHWCEDSGMKEKETMSLTSFGRKLSGRFDKQHTRSGVVYRGVGLAANSDGFVRGSEANISKTERGPEFGSYGGETSRIPSQPVTTLESRENPSRLSSSKTGEHDNAWDEPLQDIGMSKEQAISIWDQQGRPVIRLGLCDNCFDLAKLLTQKNAKWAQVAAVKEWLVKHKKQNRGEKGC